MFETIWYEIWKYLQDNYFNASVGDRYQYLSFDQHTGMTLFSIMVGLAIGMIIASYVLLFQRNRIGRFVRKLLEKGAKTPATAQSLEELGLEKDAFVKLALNRHSAVRRIVNTVMPDTIYIRNLYYSEMTEEMVEREIARVADEQEKAKRAERLAIEEEKAVRRAHAEDVGAVEANADSEASDVSNAGATLFGEEGGDAEPIVADDARGPHKLPRIRFEVAKFYIPEEYTYRAEQRFRKEKHAPLMAVLATVIFLVLGFLMVRFTPLLLGLLDMTVGAIAAL